MAAQQRALQGPSGGLPGTSCGRSTALARRVGMAAPQQWPSTAQPCLSGYAYLNAYLNPFGPACLADRPLTGVQGGHGHHAWQAGSVPKAMALPHVSAAERAAAQRQLAGRGAAEGGQQACLCSCHAQLLSPRLLAAPQPVLLQVRLDAAGGGGRAGRGLRPGSGTNDACNKRAGCVQLHAGPAVPLFQRALDRVPRLRSLAPPLCCIVHGQFRPWLLPQRYSCPSSLPTWSR